MVSADEIDQWLPQTQCTQCSYPRCRDYAEAIYNDQADINQCPPGGEQTIRGLASLLGKIGKPLNPQFGEHRARQRAIIDEDVCIGCVICIAACPVDAIVGTAKRMHTVLEADCTGCELCVEPCPVDCIAMIDDPQTPKLGWRWPDYSPEDSSRARQQTNTKLLREKERASKRTSLKRLRELRDKSADSFIKNEIKAIMQRKAQDES